MTLQQIKNYCNNVLNGKIVLVICNTVGCRDKYNRMKELLKRNMNNATRKNWKNSKM